jgi:hypothetical protein
MEQSIDLRLTLDTLKKQIASEKEKLDYLLKGAELLAQMLAQAANKNEPRERQNIEYSELGLSPEEGRPERNPL